MPSGYRVTREEAIARAIAKHGDEYDYARVEFSNLKDKVLITHKNCGELWNVSFANHINSGVKCGYCYVKRRKNTESFLQECRILYPNNEYSYDNVEYGVGNRDKVSITCNGCKEEFRVTPFNFLISKSGCPACAQKRLGANQKISFEEFVIRAQVVHGNKFSYFDSTFIGIKEKTDIKCSKCECTFKQAPDVHLRKSVRCPFCLNGSEWRSVPEMEWLDKLGIDKKNRHRNVLRKNVDALVGNIIYEFYGGYWHGDPRKKDGSRELLRERYMKTMAREKFLKEAGYDIVFVWEYDYKNGLMFSKEHPQWID